MITIPIIGFIRHGLTIELVLGGIFCVVMSLLTVSTIRYRLRIKDGYIVSEEKFIRVLNRRIEIASIESVSMPTSWFPQYYVRSGKRLVTIISVRCMDLFLRELQRQNPSIIFNDAVVRRLEKGGCDEPPMGTL